MLSVLIPALNEAQNIALCVRSVAFADEVVVVDSGSTDGTVELAEANGAKVIRFDWNGRWPKKKNWALDSIPWKNEWLLILDADERVTPPLAQEICHALKSPACDGYFLNRQFFFMGRWIRHAGYYPSWNLRLFKHARGRYERLVSRDTHSGDNEIHEHLVLSGRTGRLKQHLLHLAYPDVFTWVEKHNRYSNWEAAVETADHLHVSPGASLGRGVAFKRFLRTRSRSLPFRPALRFFYSYILRLGFLDGYPGYVLCRLLATYELLSVLKAQELRMARRNVSSDRAAQRAAEQWRLDQQEFRRP